MTDEDYLVTLLVDFRRYLDGDEGLAYSVQALTEYYDAAVKGKPIKRAKPPDGGIGHKKTTKKADDGPKYEQIGMLI